MKSLIFVAVLALLASGFVLAQATEFNDVQLCERRFGEKIMKAKKFPNSTCTIYCSTTQGETKVLYLQDGTTCTDIDHLEFEHPNQKNPGAHQAHVCFRNFCVNKVYLESCRAKSTAVVSVDVSNICFYGCHESVIIPRNDGVECMAENVRARPKYAFKGYCKEGDCKETSRIDDKDIVIEGQVQVASNDDQLCQKKFGNKDMRAKKFPDSMCTIHCSTPQDPTKVLNLDDGTACGKDEVCFRNSCVNKDYLKICKSKANTLKRIETRNTCNYKCVQFSYLAYTIPRNDGMECIAENKQRTNPIYSYKGYCKDGDCIEISRIDDKAIVNEAKAAPIDEDQLCQKKFGVKDMKAKTVLNSSCVIYCFGLLQPKSIPKSGMIKLEDGATCGRNRVCLKNSCVDKVELNICQTKLGNRFKYIVRGKDNCNFKCVASDEGYLTMPINNGRACRGLPEGSLENGYCNDGVCNEFIKTNTDVGKPMDVPDSYYDPLCQKKFNVKDMKAKRFLNMTCVMFCFAPPPPSGATTKPEQLKLDDGTQCKTTNMECFKGFCERKDYLKTCQSKVKGLKKLMAGECNYKCVGNDDKSVIVPINNAKSCTTLDSRTDDPFEGFCHKGDCIGTRKINQNEKTFVDKTPEEIAKEKEYADSRDRDMQIRPVGK